MTTFWQDNDSKLKLIGIGMPRYSARDLVQTYKPIAADLERTIDGILRDLTYEPFKKLATTITCSDLESPALDGVFPGKQVEVWCVKELVYPLGGSPSRPVVPGSARELRAEGSPDYETFIAYCPILQCMVVNYQDSFAEWKAKISWQLELQEI